jgi:hypothetical protein
MNIIRKYNFEVETLHAGQLGRYKDSEYHYIIRDNNETQYSEYVIWDFCQFIKKSHKKTDMPNWASPRCVVFKKINDNSWEYKVTEAYTD